MGGGKLSGRCGEVNSGALAQRPTPHARARSGLTLSHCHRYLSKLIFGLNLWTGWVISHDADVQSSEPEAEEQARVPGPYADQGGSQDPQSASAKRPAASGGDRRIKVGPWGRHARER